MATQTRKIPSYRLHKPSGLGVVRLDGHDHYLGSHGTPTSQEAYHRLIAEWLASGGRVRGPASSRDGAHRSSLTIDELILAFLRHAQVHYRRPDGSPTRELDNFRDALRPLRQLYGSTPTSDFGPLSLRALQQEMIKLRLCRSTINSRIRRVRQVFKWAASLELIPPTVVQALATVPPLRRGRCDAPESKGVAPVDWAVVDATLPHLPRPVAAMVRLMRLSSCRAQDVVLMRSCDLRTTGEIWVYEPSSHKNSWRGRTRIVFLGPQAQAVIRPFLKGDLDAYLFCPRDAVEEFHARRRQQRATKRTPSEQRRTRKAVPKWQQHSRYSVNTFQQAVRRTCRRVGLPSWSVLQVRHSRGTEVREIYGVEGAASSLGHQRVETAQIYAQQNLQLARRIAKEIG
jgi:integrase